MIGNQTDSSVSESAPLDPVLETEGLEVSFPGGRQRFNVVDGMSFAIRSGRTVGMVGESGSGKSMTALAILGLVPPPGHITAGRILHHGKDLAAAPEAELRALRGNAISMIFQEPMTALNPVMTIGSQIGESFVLHRGLSRRDAEAAAVDVLSKVGMPDPGLRAQSYPHQLSGGMRQRAMIAMALACEPELLIADEPTTALDTTIQAQILELILESQANLGMAVLFISHNLGVISEVADDVLVVYGGRVVEQAPAAVFFDGPLHPYSKGLLETLPRADMRGHALPTIPGNPVDPRAKPSGCAFAPRCALAEEECRRVVPPPKRAGPDRVAACLKVTP
jgi:oligopeptide/dipeptide ABC transporter ATP-binding protein